MSLYPRLTTMSKQTIVVADSDPKNLQILKENLESANFQVRTATDGLQAWEQIVKDSPAIVLSEVSLPGLDGLQLLERLQQDKATAFVPLVFLTNKRELQDRIRSLKMGAKDYLVKPLHVKEVIAHIKMVLGRLERRKPENGDSFFKIMGKLEELNVFDLIENFGVEQKTGILTVHNNNNKSGQIYFRQGCVVGAIQGDFRREKAIYQMLPWKKGYFTMVFKDVTVKDEIAVSNLGLLLQGLKRMEQREKYLKEFPSPHLKFVLTSIFRKILSKKKATKDLIQFVSLFDGRRDILEIIDDSCYDDLKTLERLIRLYRQGFIKPVQPVEPTGFREAKVEPAVEQIPERKVPAEQEPIPPEVKTISEPLQIKAPPYESEEESVTEIEEETADTTLEEPEHIQPMDQAVDESIDQEEIPIPKMPQPKLVVPEPVDQAIPPEAAIQRGVSIFIGDAALGENGMFNAVTEGNYRTRSFMNQGIGDIKFGRIKLYENFELDIISISQNAQISRLLDHFSAQLKNYLLIVDCSQSETLDYNGYLARTLYDKYNAPFFIVAVNQEKSDISSMDVLRDRIGLNAEFPIVACDSMDKESILDIISKFIVGLPKKKHIIKGKKSAVPVEV